MIIRVLEDNTVVVLSHIAVEDEDLFLETNSNMTSFKKVESVPPSPFNKYKLVNGEVVVDEAATEIEVQRLMNIQSREVLNSTDWKVIRELEKLYLSDTDLHAERQAIRDSITNV